MSSFTLSQIFNALNFFNNRSFIRAGEAVVIDAVFFFYLSEIMLNSGTIPIKIATPPRWPPLSALGIDRGEICRIVFHPAWCAFDIRDPPSHSWTPSFPNRIFQPCRCLPHALWVSCKLPWTSCHPCTVKKGMLTIPGGWRFQDCPNTQLRLCPM